VRSLAAGMTGSDDKHIKNFWVLPHNEKEERLFLIFSCDGRGVYVSCVCALLFSRAAFS
jgi:hypothetical protein